MAFSLPRPGEKKFRGPRGKKPLPPLFKTKIKKPALSNFGQNFKKFSGGGNGNNSY